MKIHSENDENAVNSKLTDNILSLPVESAVDEVSLLEYFRKKSVIYAHEMLKLAGLDPATCDQDVVDQMAGDYLAGAAAMCEQHPSFVQLEDAGGARLRGLAQQLRAIYA